MNYFLLIPISIGLGLTGLCAFFWSLRHDQYEDLAGAARRILFAADEPIKTPPLQEGPDGKLAANPDHTDSNQRL